MSLPAPASSFTIPSLHDDLELDCRIYYPRRANIGQAEQLFAILAHPYAPLGGSYDDGVVNLVGSTLLRSGVLLGTFNFRGAANSAGKTSWSGKAELGDYVAFYAFMLSYISATQSRLAQEKSRGGNELTHPLLILGGYSYGSMIASCLPNQDLVLQLLMGANENSAEHEIQSRAEQMAADFAAYVRLSQQGSFNRGRRSLRATDAQGTVVGGYDSEAANRRISRESSRRSFDGPRIRQSLERARQKLTTRSNSDRNVTEVDFSRPVANFAHPANLDTAYLLVSPLLPPVSALTTMFSTPSFERRIADTKHFHKASSAKEEKFSTHPTCFIYGGKDVFTSSKKMKKWVEELRSRSESMFSSYETESAGHFWTEPGVSAILQANVSEWLLTLLQTSNSSHNLSTEVA